MLALFSHQLVPTTSRAFVLVQDVSISKNNELAKTKAIVVTGGRSGVTMRVYVLFRV